ncbi:uncharacterized protein LOC112494040 [Cephus cinctus]|uniref:Uncharacterized protein LOC112494040 n=1 Tax=Cephus cinctus TaxID=211228 RepID=A0AAJ7RCV1_CEPCN|nr:uncharacterized protein LOC112494040 [Cephus cinctus]
MKKIEEGSSEMGPYPFSSVRSYLSTKEPRPPPSPRDPTEDRVLGVQGKKPPSPEMSALKRPGEKSQERKEAGPGDKKDAEANPGTRAKAATLPRANGPSDLLPTRRSPPTQVLKGQRRLAAFSGKRTKYSTIAKDRHPARLTARKMVVAP